MLLKDVNIELYFTQSPTSGHTIEIPLSVANELVDTIIFAAHSADVGTLAGLAAKQLDAVTVEASRVLRLRTKHDANAIAEFNALCAAVEQEAPTDVNGHAATLLLAWQLSQTTHYSIDAVLSEGNLIFSSFSRIFMPQTGSGGEKNDLPHQIEADMKSKPPRSKGASVPVGVRDVFTDAEWQLYRKELAAFREDAAKGKIPRVSEQDLKRDLSASTKSHNLDF